jgi:hypothetical protein
MRLANVLINKLGFKVVSRVASESNIVLDLTKISKSQVAAMLSNNRVDLDYFENSKGELSGSTCTDGDPEVTWNVYIIFYEPRIDGHALTEFEVGSTITIEVSVTANIDRYYANGHTKSDELDELYREDMKVPSSIRELVDAVKKTGIVQKTLDKIDLMSSPVFNPPKKSRSKK